MDELPKDQGQQFKQPNSEQKTEQPQIIVNNQPARVELKMGAYVFWVIGALFLIALVLGLPTGVTQKDESALSLLYVSVMELVFLFWLFPPIWPLLLAAFFFYPKAQKTGKISYLRVAEIALIGAGAFLAYAFYDLLANEQADS